jgi:hypothetical protein
MEYWSNGKNRARSLPCHHQHSITPILLHSNISALLYLHRSISGNLTNQFVNGILLLFWDVIHNRRRLQVRVLEHPQCRCDDRLLLFGVIRFTQRVPVVERDNQRARGPHFLSDVTQQLNCHRRDALTLQFGCDQTHGLVAYRSDRYQQGDIDTVFNQFAHRWRRGFFYQAPGRCNGSHEGQMPPV